MVRHYCTYFDSGFLIQGLALWRSLKRHDVEAVLWVLALDDRAAECMERLDDVNLRIVRLAELEAADPGLAEARDTRSRIEYYFTLSPCLPRWLLCTHEEIESITYLDADLLVFSSPHPIFASMDTAGASVLITAHRFPSWLKHLERHGRYNVGVQVFRNNAAGMAVLEDWRTRCLEWCFDRVEPERYADQKYLDAWPNRFGRDVLVLDDAGVNLAPWNGCAHRLRVESGVGVTADGSPLTIFHFASFRPLAGTWLWQSGQLRFGVMPWSVRQVIYGTYWRALRAARDELARAGATVDFVRRPIRWQGATWRIFLFRVAFGTDWIRLGNWFVSGRFGLGRFCGRVFARMSERGKD